MIDVTQFILISVVVSLTVVLIVIGIVNLYYAGKFFKDPAFAKNYIQKSPKALIWRKLFGEEKAIKMTKTIFAPIGIILGIGLILAGFYTILSS